MLAFVFAGLPLQSCKRKAVPRSAENSRAQGDDQDQSGEHERFTDKAWTDGSQTRVVLAAWYKVPIWSLAKRRAGLDELTAAHNRLPLGTRLRVTNPENGKSVTVRITDRGIHDRRVKLDLCKEAAEELEIVSKGLARLQMQVIPDAEPATVLAH